MAATAGDPPPPAACAISSPTAHTPTRASSGPNRSLSGGPGRSTLAWPIATSGTSATRSTAIPSSARIVSSCAGRGCGPLVDGCAHSSNPARIAAATAAARSETPSFS